MYAVATPKSFSPKLTKMKKTKNKALRADKTHHFSSLLVAGVERHPLQVTRRMSKKKIQRRTKVKPFLKRVNVTHVMPTRYAVDLDLASVVSVDKVYGEKAQKSKVAYQVRKLLEERYKSGKNRWFFTKLRF